MGYPCVGWLLLLRRRYTHRCLQIWLPPAASDWIRGWDSAPQNTTRKHKMASRTSAILGLLKNTIRSTFQGFFSLALLSRDEERAAVLSRVMENQSCAKYWDEANRPRRHTLSQALSERATLTFLIRQPESSQRKSIVTACPWLRDFARTIYNSPLVLSKIRNYGTLTEWAGCIFAPFIIKDAHRQATILLRDWKVVMGQQVNMAAT